MSVCLCVCVVKVSLSQWIYIKIVFFFKLWIVNIVLTTMNNQRSLPFFVDTFHFSSQHELYPTTANIKKDIPQQTRDCPKLHMVFAEDLQKLMFVQAALKNVFLQSDSALLLGLTRIFKEVKMSET